MTAVPCQYCGSPAFGGPAHRCCYAWRAVIEAGNACPACQVAKRLASNRGWLHALQALPQTLPNGRPYVPEYLGPGRP